MSLHFTILNEFSNLVNSGQFDPDESQPHKLLLMKVLIKCADLAVMARPFDVARKNFDFVTEEFYRKGDIERCDGIVFIGADQKREDIDKKASFVGFAKNVALPLFQTLGKQISLLSSPADQIKENISKYQAQKDLKK